MDIAIAPPPQPPVYQAPGQYGMTRHRHQFGGRRCEVRQRLRRTDDYWPNLLTWKPAVTVAPLGAVSLIEMDAEPPSGIAATFQPVAYEPAELPMSLIGNV